jgi:hypothetical protein
MERLFTPCTRLYDILESQGYLEEFRGLHPDVGLQELNLNVSTEELLSAERAFTYADLYAMLRNGETIVWLTPHAFVARNGLAHRCWPVVYACDELNNESPGFSFSADGKDLVVLALSKEHLLEIFDVIARLLAVSVVHSVEIETWCCPDGAAIYAPTLAYLMEQCQSLKKLSLEDLRMDENHCRVLGDYSRPDLEIVLDRCKITSAGAGALAEVLGRNQGPTKLDSCEIDNFVIANGLRGNSSLKSLRSRLSYNPDDGNRELVAIAGALRENRGLVDLNFPSFRVSDEAWDAVCNSLETHPTLEILDLRSREGYIVPLAVPESRIHALMDMMKVNMSIHTIQLDDHYYEYDLFRESVIPYLETNRLRPRLLAIQKTLPHEYRAKVLGRALLAVRTDPNLFWMLLSGNAEVAFPSTTATITAAASIPTPANVAATENVAPVVATASAAAASSVVASAIGQKRKACP